VELLHSLMRWDFIYIPKGDAAIIIRVIIIIITA
jgi:hypothetical protein